MFPMWDSERSSHDSSPVSTCWEFVRPVGPMSSLLSSGVWSCSMFVRLLLTWERHWIVFVSRRSRWLKQVERWRYREEWPRSARRVSSSLDKSSFFYFSSRPNRYWKYRTIRRPCSIKMQPLLSRSTKTNPLLFFSVEITQDTAYHRTTSIKLVFYIPVCRTWRARENSGRAVQSLRRRERESEREEESSVDRWRRLN